MKEKRNLGVSRKDDKESLGVPGKDEFEDRNLRSDNEYDYLQSCKNLRETGGPQSVYFQGTNTSFHKKWGHEIRVGKGSEIVRRSEQIGT